MKKWLFSAGLVMLLGVQAGAQEQEEPTPSPTASPSLTSTPVQKRDVLRLKGFGTRETIKLRPRGKSRRRPAQDNRYASLVHNEIIPTEMPDGVEVPDELQIYLRDGRDAILNRDYAKAEEIFGEAETEYPDSPVGSIGRMLVHQSVMLENFDFSREKEFNKAVKHAQKRVKKSVKKKGNDAWDHLVAGAFHGIVGVQEIRRKKYMGSLGSGWDAVRSLKACEKQTDEIKDLELGLGAYDYFRSVIKRQAPWVPFFPDRRAEGIARMERTLEEGEFTRPIAQLALIFTLIDEKQYSASIELSKDLIVRYPGNVIARVQLGRAYSRMGRYKDAIHVFEEVLELHPENRVVRYYLGSNRVYMGKELDIAERDLLLFLEDPPSNDWKGWAYERMGDLHRKRKDMEQAVHYWKKAQKLVPKDKSVKRKLKAAARQKEKEKKNQDKK